ncbi:MAG: hypothetical protein LBU51_04760 [Bacteroidales bacterium]|jgi:hypothetical protein|nr:hypothetical protein [Bacteroidales bacterium]
MIVQENLYLPRTFDFKTPYIGLSLKASYLAAIHNNMFIQPEVGIKFLPFLFAPNHWYIDEASEICVFEDEDHPENLFNRPPDEIIYMRCKPVISASSYFIPDLTFALNFIVHGKNLHNNFGFGINVNIGFVDRIHFVYQSTDVLPAYAQSSGEFGWRMSAVGFHIGYLFMKEKKKIIDKLR